MEKNNIKTNFFIKMDYKENELCLDEWKKMFDRLKEKDVILSGNFEDDVWTAYDTLVDHNIYIKFQNIASQRSILALKKYAVAKLCLHGQNSKDIKSNVKEVIDMLNFTHLLHKDYLNDFKNYVMTDNKQKYLSYYKGFLAFTDMQNASYYYNELSSLHFTWNRKIRNLPCYSSIILFDMLLRRYADTEDMQSKIKYYPVLLWWILSVIIPLRPSEFLHLKRNCIYIKNEKYYIHIDRIKLNSNNNPPIPIMTEFQIPENVYQFINDFVDYANELDDSEYLFSHDYYTSNYKKAGYKNVPKINLHNFRAIFKHFTNEVIEEKYGYKIVEQGQKTQDHEIERIKPGDTRHLAFMNMMMQGLNPLYIQKLGGHYTLNEQIHYCSHLDTFMSSKTYLLSKFFKEKDNNLNFSMNEDINAINWSMKQTEKELLGLQFYKLPQVKDGAGRCTSKNVPYDCICEECLFCQHFIPEKNVSNQYIEEMRKSNQQNIEIKKKLLQTLLKEQIKNESEISQTSKNLATLTNQKMIIDAYTLNMKEDDTNE